MKIRSTLNWHFYKHSNLTPRMSEMKERVVFHGILINKMKAWYYVLTLILSMNRSHAMDWKRNVGYCWTLILYMTEMLLLIQLCESCLSLEAVCTVFGSALSHKHLKAPLSSFNPGNVPSLNSVAVPGTEAFRRHISHLSYVQYTRCPDMNTFKYWNNEITSGQ